MPTKSSNKSSELTQKIDEFLSYLETEKDFSPLTIRNYRHYLNRFIYWNRKEKTSQLVKDINTDRVRQYRLYLSKITDEKGKTLSLKTQGFHLIALRSFLRWLRERKIPTLDYQLINVPKANPHKIKTLGGKQIDKLLNSPSLSTIQGKRDKAIMEIFYSSGLRVSELTRLDRDKIDFRKQELRVAGRKGKTRIIFLSSRAAQWVKKYINARRDKYSPLFIRHKGKMDPSIPDEKMRLTPRSVQRMIKKYVRKVGLTVDVTPQVIRSSFATDLLMAGADIKSVQEMLGHKNISTTQIYTHVTHKHLRDVHSAFHGKGGK